MRIWSIHPCELDAKGLVALWRETLLARAVLGGQTRGYLRHPQLERFRAGGVPLVERYLHIVADEADNRGYRFARHKLASREAGATLPVTAGQLAFEWQHLRNKLAVRDPERWARTADRPPALHPLFHLVEGEIEAWERA